MAEVTAKQKERSERMEFEAMIPARSFAVNPTRSKAKAVSPLSVDWTLYDPKTLANKLGLPVEKVEKALEETGFNKSTRQRMELIRYKIRVQHEITELNKYLHRIHAEKRAVRKRMAFLQETCVNLHNILKMPREAPKRNGKSN